MEIDQSNDVRVVSMIDPRGWMFQMSDGPGKWTFPRPVVGWTEDRSNAENGQLSLVPVVFYGGGTLFSATWNADKTFRLYYNQDEWFEKVSGVHIGPNDPVHVTGE